MYHRALKVRHLILVVLICSSVPTAALSETLIKPSLAITESYNSNPLSRNKDQNVDDDYITKFTPQISVTTKRKGYSLNVYYQMNSASYHEEPANNDISHMAGADIAADITKRMSISLKETYRATKDSLSAIEEGIQTSRDDIIYNSISLNIKQMLSPDASVTLGAAFKSSDFENPALFDTMTKTASIGARYRLSAQRFTNLAYIFSKYSSDTAGGVNHNETHSLQAGVNEALSPSLTFALSGLLVYTPDISEDYDWASEAKLTKILKKTTAKLSYKRSISNSSGLSEEIAVSDRVKASLTHEFRGPISTTISGALTKSRSKPSGSVDLSSYSAGMNVSWQAYPWLKAGLGYTRFSQWSAGAGAGDIDKEQVSITLTLKPRQWRL